MDMEQEDLDLESLPSREKSGKPTTNPSPFRLWLYRIASVLLIPAAILLFLEGGLRVIGFGHPGGFTIPCTVNDMKKVCLNETFTETFFPPKIARHSLPFALSRTKPPETYRIFILGGSAAQGDPMPSYSFSRILERMLSASYPSMRFEVINSAITAINSHVVLQIAKDLAHLQPDLFLVYLGNNEVVGPYGAGTVFAPLSPNLTVIRTGILLKKTRVGQLLRKTLFHGKEGALKEWRGMEMFLKNQVRASDPRLSSVYRNFRGNLEEIGRVCKASGAKVIFSTVGVNLKDSPPFGSLVRPDLEEEKKFKRAYEKAILLSQEGKFKKAIPYFLQAEKIDDTYSELHFRLGQAYLANGENDLGRRQLVLAREMDSLRFRADESINKEIREIAGGREKENIFLVDGEKIFMEQSPSGIPGRELFVDHVHLNFHGNYLLAKSMVGKITPLLPRSKNGKIKKSRILSEDECKRQLAYSAYDRLRILKDLKLRFEKAPFTNQIGHDKAMGMLAKGIKDVNGKMRADRMEGTLKKYLHAEKRFPGDPWLLYNYGRALQYAGKHEEAVAQFTEFINLLPTHIPAYEKLAQNLISSGEFKETISVCRKALRKKPGFLPVRYHLAYALARSGKIDTGIREYEKIISLDPGSATEIYNQVGIIQLGGGDITGAEESFRKAIKSGERQEKAKDLGDAHFNLAATLKRLGIRGEARKEFRAAEKLYSDGIGKDPDSASSHAVLGRTFYELGEVEKAEVHYRKAIALEPSDPSFHLQLIKLLERGGDLQEARNAARDAGKVMERKGRKEDTMNFNRYQLFLEKKLEGKK